MSTTIDSKVVEMRFDNKQFEKGVAESISTLDRLKAKLSSKDLSNGINTEKISSSLASIGYAAQGAGEKFSAMSVVAISALSTITSQAVMAGGSLVKSLSVDQIYAGWEKYERLMETTQMMMSATRDEVGTTWADRAEQMDYINGKIEKLMWYSDETSYNFVDMAENIGKFTANGIALDDSVVAMMGVANWAALSGANVQQAARAMYNLSQALALGSVRVQDWMSIENANMATAEFKQNVIDTGLALHTLHEVDGIVQTWYGTAVTVENFRSTLSEGWVNKDVLTKTLTDFGQFAYDLSDAVDETGLTATEFLGFIDDYKSGAITLEELTSELSSMDYVDADKATEWIVKLSDSYYDLGMAAFKAGQESKTFKDSLNATKDAVSTGWTKIFTTIMGDYLESVELWSSVSEEMYWAFAEELNNVNRLLDAWGDLGGREDIVNIIASIWYSIRDVIDNIRDGFDYMFPKTTAEQLYRSIKKVSDAISHFTYINIDSTWAMNNVRQIGVELGIIFRDLKRVFQIVAKAAGEAWTKIFPKDNNAFRNGIIAIGDALSVVADKFNRFYATVYWHKDDIQHAFEGAFAVLDIFRQLIIAILKPISQFRLETGNLLEVILEGSGSIGEWLVALDNWIRETGYFDTVVAEAISYLQMIPGILDNILYNLTGLHIYDIVDAAMAYIKTIPDEVSKIVDRVRTEGLIPVTKDIAKYVLGIPRKIVAALDEMTDVDLMPMYDKVVNVIKDIIKYVGKFITWAASLPGKIDKACLDYFGYHFYEVIGGVIAYIIQIPGKINSTIKYLTGSSIGEWFVKLADLAKKAAEKIKEFFESLRFDTDAEGNLIEYGSVLEGIKARFEKVKKSVGETVSKIKEFLGFNDEAVDATTGKKKTFFEYLSEKIQSAKESLLTFKEKLDLCFDILNGDYVPENPTVFEQVFLNLKEVLDSIKGSLEWLKEKKDDLMGEGSDTGSVFDAFEADDPKAILKSLSTIGKVGVALFAVYEIISLIFKAKNFFSGSDEKKTPITFLLDKLRDVKDAINLFGGIQEMMKIMAIAFAISKMAGAIVALASLPEDALTRATVVVEILFGNLYGMLLSLSFINTSSLMPVAAAMKQFGLLFLDIAGAIAILKLVKVTPEEAKSYAETLTLVMTCFAAIMVSTLMIKGVNLGQLEMIVAAFTQMAASYLLIAAAIAVVTIAGDPEDVKKYATALMEALVGVAAILVGMIVVLSKVPTQMKTVDVAILAMAVDGMATAFLLIAASIAIVSLAGDPRDVLAYAGILTLVFSGVVAAIVGITYECSTLGTFNGTEIAKVATAIAIASGAFVVIATSLVMMRLAGNPEEVIKYAGILMLVFAEVAIAISGITYECSRMGTSNGEDIKKVAEAITIASASFLVIAAALILMRATGDPGTIIKYAGILSLMFFVIGGAMVAFLAVGKQAGAGREMAKVGAAIDMMAASLIIIVTALFLARAAGDPTTVARYAAILGLMFVAIGGAMVAFLSLSKQTGDGKEMVLIATAVDIMAASLIIIASSLLLAKQAGNPDEIASYALTLGVLFVAIGGAMVAFLALGNKVGDGKEMVLIATAVDIMAASLAIIASALLIMGQIDSEGMVANAAILGVGLVVIAGILAGLNALTKGTDATSIVALSAALVVASSALLIIAAAMAILATAINWDNLWPVVIALAAGATVLGALAAALAGLSQIANPAGLVALAVAFVGLGAGAALAGAGFLAFAEAINILSNIGVEGINTFVDSTIAFFERLPELISAGILSFNEIVGVLSEKGDVVEQIFEVIHGFLISRFTSFLSMLTDWLSTITTFLVDSAPLVAEGIAAIINAVLLAIQLIIPQAEATFSDILDSLGRVLDERVPKFIAWLREDVWPEVKLLIEDVVLGIIDIITNSIPSIMEMLETLITSLCDLIINTWPKFEEVLKTILESIIYTTIGFSPQIAEMLKTLIIDSLEALKEVLEEINTVLIEVLIDLLTKLSENMVEITEKVTEIALDLLIGTINGFTEKLPEIVEALWEFFIQLFNSISEGMDDHAEDLREAIENLGLSLWNAFKVILGIESPSKKFKELGKFIVEGLINGIDELIEDAKEKIKELADKVLEKICDIFGIDKPEEGSTSEKFKSVAISIVTSFIAGVNEKIENAKKKIQELADKILEKICEVFGIDKPTDAQEFSKIGKKIIENLINGVWSKLSTVLTSFENFAANIKSKWENIDWAKFGEYIIEGIKKGIENFKYKVTSAISSVGSSAVNKFKSVLGIESPSKVFAELGEFMDLGLAKGIDSMSKVVTNSTEDLGDASVNSLSKAISGITDIIESDIDAQPTIRPVMDLTDINAGVESIDGMLAENRSVSLSSSVSKDMSSSMNNKMTLDSMLSELKLAIGDQNQNQNGTINNTFNISGVTDPKEVAKEVSEIIQLDVNRRGNVWA